MNGYGVAPVARAMRASIAAANAVLILRGREGKETCGVLEEDHGMAVSGDEGSTTCDVGCVEPEVGEGTKPRL